MSGRAERQAPAKIAQAPLVRATAGASVSKPAKRLLPNLVYKDWFLATLILATFSPLVLSVVGYGLFGARVNPVMWTLGVVLMLSTAHMWITLAYYTDARWRTFFALRPMVFYGVPLALVGGMTLMLAFSPRPIGQAVVCGYALVNLWHHAKQNWGILALVGRIRKGDVMGLRAPVVWAWPFFLLPWIQFFPFAQDALGPWLPRAATTSGMAYLVFFGWHAARSGFIANRDPVLWLFAAAVAAYFVPIAFLPGSYLILAFMSGHALQYYTLVSSSLILNARSRTTFASLALRASLLLAVLVGITWAALSVRGASGYVSSVTGGAALGLLMGVNFVHFWVDAFIWKFTEASVRKQHGEALAF